MEVYYEIIRCLASFLFAVAEHMVPQCVFFIRMQYTSNILISTLILFPPPTSEVDRLC